MTKQRILVVDDEPAVRELIRDAMQLSGFEVETANDGLDALNEIRSNYFDLIIADINMPKLDGFQLITKLQESANQTPVLLLTARADRADVNQGLRLGADDYITKPFGLEELTLRVKAILRRTAPKSQAARQLAIGEFSMDLAGHQILYRTEALELSPTEFRLLAHLLRNTDKVVSKKQCLAAVWGIDFSEDFAIVDTYISYLRRKLRAVGFDGLETVRGVGVRLKI